VVATGEDEVPTVVGQCPVVITVEAHLPPPSLCVHQGGLVQKLSLLPVPLLRPADEVAAQAAESRPLSVPATVIHASLTPPLLVSTHRGVSFGKPVRVPIGAIDTGVQAVPLYEIVMYTVLVRHFFKKAWFAGHAGTRRWTSPSLTRYS
jgi:hypothetical protein